MAQPERYRVVVQAGGHVGWTAFRSKRLAQRAWKMQVRLPTEAGWLCWIEQDGDDPPTART